MRFFLSIRHKFLLVIVAILTVSLSCYVWLASHLFNADKKAYIYDNSAALVETTGEELTTALQSAVKTMRLVGLTVAHEKAAASAAAGDLLRALVADNDDFLEVTVYGLARGKAEAIDSFVRPEELAAYDVSPGQVKEAARQRILPLPILAAEKLYLSADRLAGKIPVLSVMIRMEDVKAGASYVVVASLAQAHYGLLKRASSVYRTYVMDPTARILVDDGRQQDAPTMEYRRQLLRAILATKSPRGVVTFAAAGEEERLVAFKALAFGGLLVVAEIPVEQAFLASRQLMERSVYFASLIIALAFFGSILFTRKLTVAIQTLYEATRKVAQGDFDLRVVPRTHDEVGALAASFTLMTGEIKRLLVETREKARMEKELETAQLVQDNFFPREDIVIQDFEVASFFKPATECGGDWWGVMKVKDSLAVMVGDATGHGVPAALLTAAAHSCVATLARMSEKGLIQGVDCGLLADQLNTAVFRAGRGRLHMTFFVMVIHMGTGKISYINASHLMPMKLGMAAAVSGMPESLGALDGMPGAIFGKEPDGQWPVHEGQLQRGESLVLVTDGLLEAHNAAGEEYGEGRLTRFLKRQATDSAGSLRTALVEQFSAFRGEGALDDDVTVLVIRRGGSEQSLLKVS